MAYEDEPWGIPVEEKVVDEEAGISFLVYHGGHAAGLPLQELDRRWDGYYCYPCDERIEGKLESFKHHVAEEHKDRVPRCSPYYRASRSCKYCGAREEFEILTASYPVDWCPSGPFPHRDDCPIVLEQQPWWKKLRRRVLEALR